MIEIKNLVHRFGDRTVLDNISLDLKKAQSLAIMGSSGGGKTTLLRCLAGLLVPTSGTILANAIDVRKEPDRAREQMGMVFQSAALFDFMTVYENVVFGIRRRLKLSKAETQNRANESLEKVGLLGNETKMPAELSGGMRKRVGIARAIALRPEVLLYDEPTTGLDPITTFSIDLLIAELQRDLGVTTVLVSHDLNSVIRVASRVAFLHEGSIVFDGPPVEFVKSDHPAIRELVLKAQATDLNIK